MTTPCWRGHRARRYASTRRCMLCRHMELPPVPARLVVTGTREQIDKIALIWTVIDSYTDGPVNKRPGPTP